MVHKMQVYQKLLPMPNRKDFNDDFIIQDIGQDAVVSNTIAPFTYAIGGQAFTVLAGIVGVLQMIVNPSQNGSSSIRI
jgi:hypothetical protein